MQTSKKKLFDGRTPTITPDHAKYDENPYVRVLQVEETRLKNLLSAERRRHAQVETLLTRQNDALQGQIADLRELYLKTIELKVGQKQ